MMKAVVKTQRGEGHVDYIDFPEPEPWPGSVKIQVKATGICGTDLHIFRDEFPYFPPVVLGHEFSGQIVALGQGVKNFQVGENVVSELPVAPCGNCRFCKTGYQNLCSNRKGLGWSANGSFAKYVIAEEQMLHLVPEGLDYDEAALCEPMAVAAYGVIELTGVQAGDVVYVSGPGPIGLLAAQAAKAEGAIVVIGGVAADNKRLALAHELKIDRIINIMEEDPVAVIQDLTHGLGADVVFECSGAEMATAQCLNAVRPGGKYTQMGLFGKSIQLDFNQIAVKELRVQGVFSSNWRSWDRALRLVSQGRVRLRPLISHCFPLSEWRQAFDLLWRREGLKVLLFPEE
jgi:L-iditol 2-dehydrogenase